MLERIVLQGYTSIRTADIALRPINVLIGANGSGKSNFISLFQFMNRVANQSMQTYVAQAGGTDQILHYGCKTTERLFIGLWFAMGNNLANGYKCNLIPMPAGDDRKRSGTSGYKIPSSLQEVQSRLPANADPRIASLLQGYFEDIYLVLKALHDHLKPGAICAFVVGNVRHAGVMVPVDQILGDVGEQIGFVRETIWVARLRGNSAQQMSRFGRESARESVVFLRTDHNA